MVPRYILSLVIAVGFVAFSCSTSQHIAMEPATKLSHDVFACKGLSADNHWVGVTDEFLPEKESKVVVVAQLDASDAQKIVMFELTNPNEEIAFTEIRKYPKQKMLGIFFDMDRLLAEGGKGEWRATVYSDGIPFGQTIFYVGEKVEKTEEEKGPHYVVVGEESESKEGKSEEDSANAADRFGKYIREVTPELPISSPVKKKEISEKIDVSEKKNGPEKKNASEKKSVSENQKTNNR